MSLGSNLYALRTSQGKTQEELAQAAGLSRVAYRTLESGSAKPRKGTLEALAAALGVSPFDLLRKYAEPVSLRFRCAKTMSRQERAKRDLLIHDSMRWLAEYNRLEVLTGNSRTFALSSLQRSDQPIPDFAERVRGACLRDHEVWSGDICCLLEQLGVKVRQVDETLKQFFGFSFGESDGGPAVVVNTHQTVPVERQVFTVAHELGHLLMHCGSYGADGNGGEVAQEEKEANTFAAFFLMPRVLFNAEWERTAGQHPVQRILHVKRVFRVSWKTVVYRLCEQAKADPKTAFWKFKAGYEQMTGLTLSMKLEPDPCDGTPSDKEPFGLTAPDFVAGRFNRLVWDAMRSEKITLSRAAELLGIPLSRLRRQLDEWEGVLA